MRERIPILISYAYLRKLTDSAITEIVETPEFRIFLDSGGFTAFNAGKPIVLGEYVAFLKTWGHKVARYAALDVVGESRASRRNLQKMWDQGLTPVPVFVTGERQAYMDELFQHSDLVAIPLSRPVSPSLAVRKAFLAVRMEWAHGRRLHWFGHAKPDSIHRWRPYSCDATTWNTAGRFGHISAYFGRGNLSPQVDYDQYVHNRRLRLRIEQVIRRMGYDPDLMLDRQNWYCDRKRPRKQILYQVTLRSWLEFALDVRQHLRTWVHLAVAPNLRSNGELYWLRHWMRERARKES